MTASRGRRPSRAGARQLLAAVPYRNEAMQLTPRAGGGALAVVPIRRPRWLAGPLSWILPFSSHRQVQLDPAGADVLARCDGRQTVETIIEQFAAEHKLSFREAQLPVMQFLRQLTERGLIAIVGLDKDESDR